MGHLKGWQSPAEGLQDPDKPIMSVSKNSVQRPKNVFFQRSDRPDEKRRLGNPSNAVGVKITSHAPGRIGMNGRATNPYKILVLENAVL